MLVRWLGTRTFRRAEGRLATNGWINGDWLTTGDWKKLPRECGGFKLVGTRAHSLTPAPAIARCRCLSLTPLAVSGSPLLRSPISQGD